MNDEQLAYWIGQPEDDHHDFKEQWYRPEHKAEMIKDIFSFINTTHHDECFLIMGVSDDRKVVGVENDSNRLNQQKIIDFIHTLPIANDSLPDVSVQEITYHRHLIDVICIADTDHVPVSLQKEWHAPNQRSGIDPGQIFAREKDVNTPRNETANFGQVKKLWQKRFHMDMPILDQFAYKLQDKENWSYYENGKDDIGIRYNLDPDFNMIIQDDDAKRNKVEGYSLDQIRTKLDWSVLRLQYRGQTIDEHLIVWLDGARFIAVVPSMDGMIIDDEEPAYYYFQKGSLEFDIQALCESLNIVGPDSGSLYHFYKGIVIYDNPEEKEYIHKLFSERFDELKKNIEPSSEEIARLASKLSIDFSGKDLETNSQYITSMLAQHKLAEEIKKRLQIYRRGQ